MKRLCSGIFVLIWVWAPTVASGMDMYPGKWWRMPQISETLKLSESQKRRLDDLFITNRRRLIDLKSSVERERFELDNLFEQEPLDEAAVMSRFKRLEAARSNLAAERFRFLLDARKIIGPERFVQLKAIYRKFRDSRRQRTVERYESRRVPPRRFWAIPTPNGPAINKYPEYPNP